MTINRSGIHRPTCNCTTCLPPARVVNVTVQDAMRSNVERDVQKILRDAESEYPETREWFGGLEVTDKMRWYNFGCPHWRHYTKYSFQRTEQGRVLGVDVTHVEFVARYFCRKCAHWFDEEPTEPRTFR